MFVQQILYILTSLFLSSYTTRKFYNWIKKKYLFMWTQERLVSLWENGALGLRKQNILSSWAKWEQYA